MSNLSTLFYNINEPYAAGFFEEPHMSLFFRYARAQRRYWENCSLGEYFDQLLYPSGLRDRDRYTVYPNYSFTIGIDFNRLSQKSERASQIIKESIPNFSISGPHTVGGAGYTHSIPNYGRIIKEGLNSYIDRINKIGKPDLKDGLMELIQGIRAYHTRIMEYLKNAGAKSELISALERVPFQPASNLYDAIVCWNLIFYLDGCDNPGRLDADLISYYNGEDITPILREFFSNVDCNNGWTGALGPYYNSLTIQCLKAITGMRRPSLELRVTDNMPDEIWDAATEAIVSGCGQPSFYNEVKYQKALSEKFPFIQKEDLLKFCGGGCTETMLAGVSNVGSLDAGINLALIFYEYMQSYLHCAADFTDFYEGFVNQVYSVILTVLNDVNEYRKKRADFKPQPVRTLFIDDCIDKETDFNAGGARYYWSVINVAGLINVIDSLLFIKTLVFDKKTFTPAELMLKLSTDYESLSYELKQCPCYGVDDSTADELATDLSAKIFKAFDQEKPYLGEAFLPSSIQFVTYADAGKNVGATPDGRKKGEPLCDSIGPVHNKDTKGPTALLNSASKLAQSLALGTPVLNLRLNKAHIKPALKPLVTGYFKLGGMQIQVNCISKDEMIAALEHPEKHENLMVRVGGYTEYFNRLSPELKKTVIERTEHIL